jgi:hypothetical protein
MINTASWCTFAAAAQTSACKWALKKTGDKASHGQRANQVNDSIRESRRWEMWCKSTFGIRWYSLWVDSQVDQVVCVQNMQQIWSAADSWTSNSKQQIQVFTKNSSWAIWVLLLCPTSFLTVKRHDTVKPSRTMQSKSWTCTSKQLHCTP